MPSQIWMITEWIDVNQRLPVRGAFPWTKLIDNRAYLKGSTTTFIEEEKHLDLESVLFHKGKNAWIAGMIVKGGFAEILLVVVLMFLLF